MDPKQFNDIVTYLSEGQLPNDIISKTAQKKFKALCEKYAFEGNL
jgi:hypothetical protein